MNRNLNRAVEGGLRLHRRPSYAPSPPSREGAKGLEEPAPSPAAALVGPETLACPPAAPLRPDRPHHRVRPHVVRSARVPWDPRDARAHPAVGGPRASNGDASPAGARASATRPRCGLYRTSGRRSSGPCSSGGRPTTRPATSATCTRTRSRGPRPFPRRRRHESLTKVQKRLTASSGNRLRQDAPRWARSWPRWARSGPRWNSLAWGRRSRCYAPHQRAE